MIPHLCLGFVVSAVRQILIQLFGVLSAAVTIPAPEDIAGSSPDERVKGFLVVKMIRIPASDEQYLLSQILGVVV